MGRSLTVTFNAIKRILICGQCRGCVSHMDSVAHIICPGFCFECSYSFIELVCLNF